MKVARQALFHCLIGVAIALLSTFVASRSALVAYPEILGCEKGCNVVATGWPFTFVSDYLGMSVVNSADITEVWFAADRFSWEPFLLNVGVWALASSAIMWVTRRIIRTP